MKMYEPNKTRLIDSNKELTETIPYDHYL